MGGRGSNAQRGHGQIKTAADMKDLQELSDYMWKTHRVYLAKSLAKANFDSVKAGAANIEKLLSEFPYLKTPSGPKNQAMIRELNGACRKRKAYAEASFDGKIQINASIFRDKSKLDASYANDLKSHFHPNGTNSDGVIVHEAGHIIESALIRKSGTPAAGYAWNHCTEATRVINEACDALRKTAAGKTISGQPFTNDQLVSKISKYAKTDRSEALAECVADYFQNGTKANPLSVQVWNILKRELK